MSHHFRGFSERIYAHIFFFFYIKSLLPEEYVQKIIFIIKISEKLYQKALNKIR